MLFGTVVPLTVTACGGTTMPDACDAAMAADLTAKTDVTIAFGGALGKKYDQPCVRVKAGTKVTFSGDFASHPLQAGGAPPAADASSPIKETKTGMSATFTMTPAGTYPYFCEFHYGDGMTGTILVE